MTGHLGLVGSHLKPVLESNGFKIIGFDLADKSGDICNESAVEKAIANCNGVVHLAAVSRVIWGEHDPLKCWETNALASERLLKLASECKNQPWVLVTSSREVYGEQSLLPVSETATTAPLNIYGKSKAYMEKCALDARKVGLNTAVVRLANVYGSIHDHVSRVLPAFCINATTNKPLRVDGSNHLFDFTHVRDVVDGIARIVNILDAGEKSLPPIHLLPGVGTTLKEAAEMAIRFAKSESEIYEAPSRNYDVCRFVGDPSLAYSLLGWRAKLMPEEGIERLVNDFKREAEQGALS